MSGALLFDLNLTENVPNVAAFELERAAWVQEELLRDAFVRNDADGFRAYHLALIATNRTLHDLKDEGLVDMDLVLTGFSVSGLMANGPDSTEESELQKMERALRLRPCADRLERTKAIFVAWSKRCEQTAYKLLH